MQLVGPALGAPAVRRPTSYRVAAGRHRPVQSAVLQEDARDQMLEQPDGQMLGGPGDPTWDDRVLVATISHKTARNGSKTEVIDRTTATSGAMKFAINTTTTTLAIFGKNIRDGALGRSPVPLLGRRGARSAVGVDMVVRLPPMATVRTSIMQTTRSIRATNP